MFSQSLHRHASRLSAAVAVVGVSVVSAGNASAHGVSTRPIHPVATRSAVKADARYGSPRGADSIALQAETPRPDPEAQPGAPVLTQAQINQIIAWMRAHLFMFPRGSFG